MSINCTMHEHYTLSLKDHRHHHHGASRRTVSHLTPLCFLSISQSEKCKVKVICLSRVKSLLLVDVLMPDDLVGDPVEDVEDEEGQRKGCSGDSVYPLGSVHKLLPHGVHVFWDWRLRVWSWRSVLNSWAVFRWQTLGHVVASKIKAAFTHILILKNTCTCGQSDLD